MIDKEMIKQKIQSLEVKAEAIEKRMTHLINNINIIPDHELIAGGTPWDPPVYLNKSKFGESFSEISQFQRSLIRDYNEWYHQAITLINLYCPDKEKEFRDYYQGIGSSSGIQQILNLTAEFPENFNNEAVLQRLLYYFDMQRAILSALLETLDFYRHQDESTIKPDSQKTGIIVVQTQGQSQKLVSDNSTVNVFKELRESIEKSDIDITKKEDLRKQIDNLENSQKTPDYISHYQQFMNTIASHITVIQPFIQFLTSLLPK